VTYPDLSRLDFSGDLKLAEALNMWLPRDRMDDNRWYTFTVAVRKSGEHMYATGPSLLPLGNP